MGFKHFTWLSYLAVGVFLILAHFVFKLFDVTNLVGPFPWIGIGFIFIGVYKFFSRNR